MTAGPLMGYDSCMSAKAQHYLPQAYLRNFAHKANSTSHVWFFDKFTDKTGHMNIHNACQEAWFYDFKDADGNRVEIDAALIPYEAKLLTSLNAIITDPSANTIANNRKTFAHLVAFLFTRSATFRRESLDMLVGLQRADPELKLRLPTEDEIKYDHIQFMSEAIKHCATRIYEMQWILVFNNTRIPFYTSDYPFYPNVPAFKSIVRLDKDRQLHFPSPTLLFEEDKIQVFFPLTPKLGIVFADPAEYSKVFMKPIAGVTEEEVRLINRTQVLWCLRFLFSSTNDFSMAEAMLQENPHLGDRERPRVSVRMNEPFIVQASGWHDIEEGD